MAAPQQTPSLTLRQLLRLMVERGASDLHITTGSPPQLRIDGNLVPLRTAPLKPRESKALCYEVMTEDQRLRFEKGHEIDFSFGVKQLSRFRANVFLQRGAITGAFRSIPFEIRPIADLGVPPVVEELCTRPRGLVLVTGPTGSGKSTTLASMIDKINSEHRHHIVTVEDPIEFLHSNKLCIVNQREVGSDTTGFKDALKYVLRQDPDVVLIGEMRDLETIEAALTISETGHLVFATLHTNTAAQSINRIIDVFPSGQQSQIRAQLSFVLQGVLSQMLLPRCDGPGRVMACEALVPNAAIRNLIREDKIHQMYGIMQTGQETSGMQTMNQSLLHLVAHGVLDRELAEIRSPEQEEFRQMLMNLDRKGYGASFG
ncbi:MAG: type IV pilus twitching motility protein PilT [Myxococcota bacterium]